MKLAGDDVERIEVTGSTIAMVDVTSSSTGIVVDTVTLDRVPVPRNLTSVALLAPGTTQGDSAFGDLPSIGGASVGENGYYINGLNITNFRTGVGSSEPPFDMYETFEVLLTLKLKVVATNLKLALMFTGSLMHFVNRRTHTEEQLMALTALIIPAMKKIRGMLTCGLAAR